MHKTLFIIGILFLLFVSCACSPEEKTDGIKIVQWNVQNVFDNIDDGTEYDEYKSSGHWSMSLFELRLQNINTVFSYSELKDADIIVLNEVENENVVKAIMKLKAFRSGNFKYYVVAKEEGGAISTAVISKYPIDEVRLHAVDECRPVIETKINVGFGFYLLACHGKSRKEGVKETSSIRLELGKTLRDTSESILAKDSNAIVAIAGDFNEDWKDENVFGRIGSGIVFRDNPLLISGNENTGAWYCFWLDETLNLPDTGSYYYNGEWSCFDNILLFGGSPGECGVVNSGILRKSDFTPNAWIRDPAIGVSDHFPVYLTVRD